MMSSSQLISVETLHSFLEKDRPIRLLDASFALPGSGVDVQADFEAGHLPGAQFFDVNRIADLSTDLPHMLPSAEDFAGAISGLGISSDDLVVVYHNTGIPYACARAWWMFRVFGHDNVRVLDGGMAAWSAAGLSLESGRSPAPAYGMFNARFHPEMVCDKDHIRLIVDHKETATILDARSKERFDGSVPEPRPGLVSGHIPGSLNLPFGDMINSETGRFKSPDALKAIFDGMDLSGEIVTSCGSGVTACVLTLGLNEAGYDNIRVYDGSWAEWGMEILKNPIERTL